MFVQLAAVCMECRETHEHSPPKKTTSVFMQPKELRKGTRLPIFMPKQDFSKTHFLPRDEADSIPFSSRHLPEILRLFAGSPMAESIEGTIATCESPAVKGETKYCATSVESMLDFVVETFRVSDPPPTLASSVFRTEHREEYQNYTIWESPEEIRLSKMVGCHTLAYPYSVVYCHTQEGGNRAFKMLMRGDNGDLVDMIVACHMDTSQWDPNHASFATLGIRRGSPVCHVFPPHGNFLWTLNLKSII